MSLDNPDGTESSVSNNTKQRRTFLKRASVTTLVASLPLSSSWARGNADGATGCSVSGNLSGNLSRDCEVTAIRGKSPSEWENRFWTEHCNDGSKFKKDDEWSIIFGSNAQFNVNSSSQRQRKKKKDDGNEDDYNTAKIKNILSGSGIDAALLAAYFNAKTGRYGELLVSAEDYVIGLHNQVLSGEVSESKMLAAIESTYQ